MQLTNTRLNALISYLATFVCDCCTVRIIYINKTKRFQSMSLDFRQFLFPLAMHVVQNVVILEVMMIDACVSFIAV